MEVVVFLFVVQHNLEDAVCKWAKAKVEIADNSIQAQRLVIIVEIPDTLSITAVFVSMKKNQKDVYRNLTTIPIT